MNPGTHVGNLSGAVRTAEPVVDGRNPSAISPEQREEVLSELKHILNSAVFRSSKRYPALLEYVVTQKLEGREDSLKERVLGVEVFGRPSTYDTNVDHVVRTAAGEVRKRLALYYMENGRDHGLRIEIPPGSYIPQFRWIAADPEPGPPVLAVVPEPAPKRLTGLDALRGQWTLVLSILANLALLLAVVGGNRISALAHGESSLDKFWAPVFQGARPLLLCVGLRNGPQQPAAAAATPVPANGSFAADPLMSRVSMADLLALTHISAYAGERHSSYRVLNPATTKFGDLRSTPTVLIGVGNNDWTRQVAERMRFTYVMNDRGTRPIAIHDRQNPSRSDWHVPEGWPETYKDYAIVSRVLDPRVEQTIVLVGGLGPHGTESAGEFVTSASSMSKLAALVPAGWETKNIQVVLSTEVVQGSSGPPKIEAAWVW